MTNRDMLIKLVVREIKVLSLRKSTAVTYEIPTPQEIAEVVVDMFVHLAKEVPGATLDVLAKEVPDANVQKEAKEVPDANVQKED